MKVILLTEAGRNIGLGHLMRMSAIQAVLNEKGIDTLLLVDSDLKIVLNSVPNDYVNWPENKKAILKYAKKFETAIVDSYLASREYFSFLRENFKKIVVIDDYNRIIFPADMIINPNIFGDILDYSNQSALITGGSDYVILRQAFRFNIKKFKISDKINEIVIMLGGSDYRNMLPSLINLFNGRTKKINVIVNNEEYKKNPVEYISNGCIHYHSYKNDSFLVKSMLKADLAISAAGQTLNELASIGLPAISICIDHDQVNNMEYFYKRGFLIKKIMWDDKDLSTLLLEAWNELRSKELRKKISRTGPKLVNKNGVENIYNRLMEIAND